MSQTYDLHASLGYQLTLLSRINERKFEQHLSQLGLTRVKWCVLLAVEEQGLKNPSDIAQFVGIDRTATSRALRSLDEDSLVKRDCGTSDRRTTEVTLTELGRARLAKAITGATENARHFSEKLTWYEHSTLTEIIQKLMQGETRDVAGL